MPNKPNTTRGSALGRRTGEWVARLAKLIQSRKAHVGIIGLGYVGLPLAVELAKAGLRVTGIDIDAEKVKAINSGRSYIQDVPSADVARLVREGRLVATEDFSALAELDTVSICVPTPLRKTKDPDVSMIMSAMKEVARHLHAGMLIVLESTTYPGTTEEMVRPEVERQGLSVGREVFLAFSPERVDPGNPTYHTKNTPKIIGGCTPTCTELAVSLYALAVDRVIPVSSSQTAEMVKLLENTFRAINIGLANEVAIMCDRLGVNVWEVIDAAATKPFGFMPFYPGPGLGGHCIPIDPLYLSWKLKTLDYNARFIQLASEINTQMPHYVVDKIAAALNDRRQSINGAGILIVGVSYKRDVEDLRESPALDIIRLLRQRGATVTYTDPYNAELRIESPQGESILRSVALPEGLAKQDCIVIVTDHRAFNYQQIVDHSSLVLDTRNATRAITRGREKVIML
ncbi:MAG TPA: nucleotide sugar dehydrogenase [Nitrospiria bacterium]|nr:nucleotide sugar dehydrogenase [Nitrospiria bacterium]